jgi:hypothetical protein
MNLFQLLHQIFLGHLLGVPIFIHVSETMTHEITTYPNTQNNKTLKNLNSDHRQHHIWHQEELNRGCLISGQNAYDDYLQKCSLLCQISIIYVKILKFSINE